MANERLGMSVLDEHRTFLSSNKLTRWLVEIHGRNLGDTFVNNFLKIYHIQIPYAYPREHCEGNIL